MKEQPTPQRLRRGEYVVIDGEDAGSRIHVELYSSPARRAYDRRLIDRAGLDACERFEALCRFLTGSPGPRDSLDPTPRGRNEMSDGQALTHAHRRDEKRALMQELGKERSPVMVGVCYLHEPIGDARNRRARLFCEGAKIAADFWGFKA